MKDSERSSCRRGAILPHQSDVHCHSIQYCKLHLALNLAVESLHQSQWDAGKMISSTGSSGVACMFWRSQLFAGLGVSYLPSSKMIFDRTFCVLLVFAFLLF